MNYVFLKTKKIVHTVIKSCTGSVKPQQAAVTIPLYYQETL